VTRASLGAERAAILAKLLLACPERLPGALRDRAAAQAFRRDPGASTVHSSVGPLRLANRGDILQLEEVLVAQEYARRGFVPRSGWAVLDVGANLGFFSAWARSLMRSGRIVAVEPVPANYHLLRLNLAAGPASPQPMGTSSGVEVVCLNAAVAATAGELEFVVPAQNSGAARAVSSGARDVAFLDLAGATRITVPSRPLDALLAEQPGISGGPIDLMKVDVEGFEAECFTGAPSTLARTRRVIFEFHSQALLEECSRLLRAARLRQVILHRNPTNPEQGTSFWRPIS